MLTNSRGQLIDVGVSGGHSPCHWDQRLFQSSAKITLGCSGFWLLLFVLDSMARYFDCAKSMQRYNRVWDFRGKDIVKQG